MPKTIVAKPTTPVAPEHSLLDTTALTLAIDTVMHHRSRLDGHPMTLEMVARESGVTKAVISNLRNGVALPSLNSTLRLLRWLGDLPPARFTRPQPGACAVCGAAGDPTATIGEATVQAGAA